MNVVRKMRDSHDYERKEQFEQRAIKFNSKEFFLKGQHLLCLHVTFVHDASLYDITRSKFIT